MQQYRVDLHMHTVLSPCGSLEMTPVNIVQAALDAKLDIIAITDHNSTKQASIIKKHATQFGLTVLIGAEITTSEEVHVLAIFDDEVQAAEMQKFIDRHLIAIKNKPKHFGYQVIVDIDEQILEVEDRLLITALRANINDIEKETHRLGGLFIPAHVDRQMNGIISHLGFIPPNLLCDAFGLSANANIKQWQKNQLFPPGSVFIQNSDAHMPEQIGSCFNVFELETPTVESIRHALKNQSHCNPSI